MSSYSKAFRFFLSGLAIMGLLILTQPAVRAAGGDLDASFGQGGIVFSNFGGNFNEVEAIVVQSDNKILVFGRGSSPTRYILARYNANGSLDTSFGQRGTVLAPFQGQPTFDAKGALALRNGKIVVVGTTQYITDRITVARYNANGTPDLSFGTGGLAPLYDRNNLQDLEAHGVAIQPDGRIVVVGEYGTHSRTYLGRSIIIYRFTTTGQLDSSFGSGGGTITPITPGGGDQANSVALQANGKIVVAAKIDPIMSRWGVLRYTAAGQLDPSFGNRGIVLTRFNGFEDEANAVKITTSGKILVAGQAGNACDNSRTHCTNADFALAQYTADGQLDTQFGTNGRVITRFDGGETWAASLALLPDGRIVSAGPTNGNLAVAVYTSRGRADSTFGSAGQTTIEANGESDTRINALGVQGNGRLLIAGMFHGNFLLVGLQAR